MKRDVAITFPSRLRRHVLNNVALAFLVSEDTAFGFHLAGIIGHDFFKPYAVTFDSQNMQIFLQR